VALAVADSLKVFRRIVNVDKPFAMTANRQVLSIRRELENLNALFSARITAEQLGPVLEQSKQISLDQWCEWPR
jgi:hypothetical protein